MKILFIHGLASSGAYKMASSLRILPKGSEVIAPDGNSEIRAGDRVIIVTTHSGFHDISDILDRGAA